MAVVVSDTTPLHYLILQIGFPFWKNSTDK